MYGSIAGAIRISTANASTASRFWTRCRRFHLRPTPLKATETYRFSANRHTGDHAGTPPTLRKLIEHYRLKETSMDTHEGKRKSTKMGYISNLDNYSCHAGANITRARYGYPD